MLIQGQPARWDTLGELLESRAAQNPDRVALTIEDESITYSAWSRLSNNVAARLAELGVVKGDRVGSFSYNRLELAVGFFAVVKLGAIWVPLNAGLVGQELERTLRDAQLKVLLLDKDLRSQFEALDAATRSSSKVYEIGAPASGSYPRFEELCSGSTELPSVSVDPTDAAAIIYTGGTTGMPKGAVLSHFAWICAGHRYVEAFEVGPGDRHLSALMMFHVGGLMFGVVGPLVGDIPSHMIRWFSVSNYWNQVRASGATIIDVIGTMIVLLCKQPRTQDDRNHSVRVCLGAVGQIPPEVPHEFEERFGIRLLRQFSQTESGGILTVYNPFASPKSESVGKPWGWAEMYIVDKYDQPHAPGVIGEIALRQTVPYTFMSGYHNNPAATVVTMRNHLLHTGDLGYIDEEGWLFFIGRQAHWLRRRGENISAYEVESVLSRFPGISEVAVVGYPSEIGEEDVKAFVVAERDISLDPAEILNWCADKLAAFKRPRYIEFVDELPRSTTKKEILRHVLRQRNNELAWDADKVLGRGRTSPPKRTSNQESS